MWVSVNQLPTLKVVTQWTEPFGEFQLALISVSAVCLKFNKTILRASEETQNSHSMTFFDIISRTKIIILPLYASSYILILPLKFNKMFPFLAAHTSCLTE